MRNKLKITIVLALLNWLVMTGPLTAGTELTKLVNKIRPAVVTVVVYDINQKVANIGSGFFIDKYGHLITNYHVLDGQYTAEVKTADGNTYPIKLIVADNKAIDLVKVLVDIPPKKFKWIKTAHRLPSIAEQILVVGSPMGLDQTVSEGIVSSIRKIPSRDTAFQLTVKIKRPLNFSRRPSKKILRTPWHGMDWDIVMLV